MTKKNKRLAVSLTITCATILVVSIIFYNFVAGGNTYFWSILFGWQWLCLLLISLIFLIKGLKNKTTQHIKGALILFVFLMLVFIPSRIVYEQRLYITGDGGPAGPIMNCLTWEMSGLWDTYDASWQVSCALMSMPSFNKFLIDQSRWTDSTDSSFTYYATFAINEAILLTGGALAFAYANKSAGKD